MRQTACQLGARLEYRSLKDNSFRVQLSLRATADQNNLHSEILVKRVTYFRPPFRKPVLLGLARRHNNRRDRPIDRCNELTLPLSLFWPRTQIPLHQLGRNSQRREKLEVVILH